MRPTSIYLGQYGTQVLKDKLVRWWRPVNIHSMGGRRSEMQWGLWDNKEEAGSSRVHFFHISAHFLLVGERPLCESGMSLHVSAKTRVWKDVFQTAESDCLWGGAGTGRVCATHG